MEQPSLYIGDLLIQEPVVLLTDLLVTVVCLYAFIQLRKITKPAEATILMKYYFLLVGITTLVSGIFGHAFLYLSEWGKFPGWVFSMVSVLFIVKAAISYSQNYLSPKSSQILNWVNILGFLFFFILVIYFFDFRYVGLYTGFGFLLFVLPAHVKIYRTEKREGSLYFLYAIGIAVIAFIVNVTKFSLHPYFVYHDLGHVIMAICGWVFFQGTLKLEEQT